MSQRSTDNLRDELESAYQRIRALEQELAEGKQRDRQREDTLLAIAQSEAFLAQSAEMAHLGYAIWDDVLDRDITVSRELARIHGLTRADYNEAVSSMDSYLEFIVPDDREEYLHYENLITADASGEAAGIEYRIVRSDGEIRNLYQRSQYIPVSSGQSTQSIVVIQDVTEAKRAELNLQKSREALEKSEAMLTQSVEIANLGHAVWDYVGENYEEVSTEWARIFGYTKEEFLAKFNDLDNDSKLIHPDDLERYRTYYDDEDPDYLEPDIEYRIVTRKNEIRHISQSHRHVFNESGERTTALVTIQDITDRIEHEIELDEARNAAEQASVAKSSFLAMMSHEIRTPLNGVLGILGLLQDTKLDGEQKTYVDTGLNSAESLLAIINDILDFSKMEAGKLDFEIIDFDLAAVVESVAEMLAARVAAKNIEMNTSISPDTPAWVVGDPGRVRQILLNLARNAVKFTDKGSVSITVTATEGASHRAKVRFEVADTGIGIPQEKHKYLFNEFMTLNDSSARKYEGTGLGLVISKILVDMMGGVIDFSSADGEGSTFWFEVEMDTVKREVSQPAARKKTQARKTPVKKLRVLLAEDNATNRLVVQAMLRKAGHHIDAVANGAEALEAVLTLPYDVVLMDIAMPEMDGLEATAAIRSLPGPEADIPIIAMTAHAMEGDRENFLDHGMTEYLRKPVNRDEVLRAIEACTADGELEGIEPPSGPSQFKDVPTLDISVLVQLAEETDPDLIPDLVGAFVSDLELRVGKIKSAIETADMAILEFETHALGGSAATFGVMKIHRLAREIELSCQASDEKQALELGATLPDLARRASQALTNYLESLVE